MAWNTLKLAVSTSLSVNMQGPNAKTLATKRELERLGRMSIECLNEGDYTFSSPAGQEILPSVSPNFEAYFADISKEPMGWEETYECLSRRLCSLSKESGREVRYVIKSMTADVGPTRGVATVYAELEMEGASEGVTLAGISTAIWKRNKEGKWLCCKLYNMRNMCGNDGLF